jgi:hypothetical protein
MGVTPSLFAMLNTAIALTKPRRMIELGNQHFHDYKVGLAFYGDHFIVKHWAEEKEIEHVSIDTSGADGAEPLDLSKPITGIAPADIVTNFGTSEHVGASGQEQCFTNILALCKPGGIMLHAVPREGHWKGHSDVTYQADTFEKIEGATLLGIWTDIGCGEDRHLIAAVLQKNKQTKGGRKR